MFSYEPQRQRRGLCRLPCLGHSRGLQQDQLEEVEAAVRQAASSPPHPTEQTMPPIRGTRLPRGRPRRLHIRHPRRPQHLLPWRTPHRHTGVGPLPPTLPPELALPRPPPPANRLRVSGGRAKNAAHRSSESRTPRACCNASKLAHCLPRPTRTLANLSRPTNVRSLQTLRRRSRLSRIAPLIKGYGRLEVPLILGHELGLG